MPRAIKKLREKYIVEGLHRAWSVWVAAFWGAAGAVVVILSALLYQRFDWRLGVLLIVVSMSFAVARFLKQPGTES